MFGAGAVFRTTFIYAVYVRTFANFVNFLHYATLKLRQTSKLYYNGVYCTR